MIASFPWRQGDGRANIRAVAVPAGMPGAGASLDFEQFGRQWRIWQIIGARISVLACVKDRHGRLRASPRGNLPFWLAYCAAVVVESAYRVLRLPGVPPLTRYRISLFRGDLVFSSCKAREAFGYQPSIRLDEGLRCTHEWWSSHEEPSA